jgi:hypothetical protein
LYREVGLSDVISALGIDHELITCLAVIIGPSMGMFRGCGVVHDALH